MDDKSCLWHSLIPVFIEPRPIGLISTGRYFNFLEANVEGDPAHTTQNWIECHSSSVMRRRLEPSIGIGKYRPNKDHFLGAGREIKMPGHLPGKRRSRPKQAAYPECVGTTAALFREDELVNDDRAWAVIFEDKPDRGCIIIRAGEDDRNQRHQASRAKHDSPSHHGPDDRESGSQKIPDAAQSGSIPWIKENYPECAAKSIKTHAVRPARRKTSESACRPPPASRHPSRS